MIDWLLWIIGAILMILSIIDIRVKAIPSIFLTAILFTVVFFNPNNLYFGILTFILAYLLYEADFFSGVADIKTMTILGFMIDKPIWLFALILLTVIFGFIWKVAVKWRSPKEKDFAFIPVFLIIYVTLILLGGIA